MEDGDKSASNKITDKTLKLYTYNSIYCSEAESLKIVNALPLLSTPAHEFQTMMMVLKQVQIINTDSEAKSENSDLSRYGPS